MFTFSRYEEKYILNKNQYINTLDFLSNKTVPDKYQNYKVNKIYFDTENYDIIRHSLEKPIYKEKLRLRYYGDSLPFDNTIFLELKKKYKKRVYKRRIKLTEELISSFIKEPLKFDIKSNLNSELQQIGSEIKSFLLMNQNLINKIPIAYRRFALAGADNLRITFDTEIFYENKLNLSNTDTILMEIKVSEAMPIDFARFLSDQLIFPISFSKYKTAYQSYIYKDSIYSE